MLPLLLLLTACTNPDDDTGKAPDDTGDTSSDSGDTSQDSGDSGDTGSGDCEVSQPVVTVSPEIPTVFTVEWTTSTAGRAWIEWGYDASYGNETGTSRSEATSHRVVVAGPAVETSVHWRARTEGSEGNCASDDQTIEIGDAYTGPTNIRMNSSSAGFHHGFRAVPVSGTPPQVVLLDDEGRVVWWRAIEAGLTAIQAEMDRDGTHMLYLLEDSDRNEDIGGIMRVSLDQNEVQFFPLHYSHHSFVQTDDGGFFYLAAEPRTFEGEEVAGDNVVRIDADGSNPQVVFTTWDHWVPDLEAIALVGNQYYPDWLDWTHGNSVNLRRDGSLLVSFHNVSSFINIAADGELLWTVGGQSALVPSDFTFQGDESTLFGNQHNPIEVDGGVLMFNNGADMRRDASAAVEYTLDEDGHTFAEAWTFDWGGSQQIAMEGDVHRYDDGNTFINWGDSGFLTEVTRDGEMVWEAQAAGSIVGFMGISERIGGSVE